MASILSRPQWVKILLILAGLRICDSSQWEPLSWVPGPAGDAAATLPRPEGPPLWPWFRPITTRTGEVYIIRVSGTGLILGLRPANERRRYFVTASLIGWAQTYTPACDKGDNKYNLFPSRFDMIWIVNPWCVAFGSALLTPWHDRRRMKFNGISFSRIEKGKNNPPVIFDLFLS